MRRILSLPTFHPPPIAAISTAFPACTNGSSACTFITALALHYSQNNAREDTESFLIDKLVATLWKNICVGTELLQFCILYSCVDLLSYHDFVSGRPTMLVWLCNSGKRNIWNGKYDCDSAISLVGRQVSSILACFLHRIVHLLIAGTHWLPCLLRLNGKPCTVMGSIEITATVLQLGYMSALCWPRAAAIRRPINACTSLLGQATRRKDIPTPAGNSPFAINL